MKTKTKALKVQAGHSSLKRPRYSPGLLLEDEDLNSAVDYTREINRLLFRSLFGCGVICGLELEAWSTCNNSRVKITLGCGVALDCMGNPIHVPTLQTFEYEDPECEPLPGCIWVVLCYKDACCRPKDTSCSEDDDPQRVATRIQSGFEIKLYDKQPACACSCEPPKDRKDRVSDGCCDDDDDDNAAQTGNPQLGGRAKDEDEDEPWMTGVCKCYADHFRGLCGCECGCGCVVIGKIEVRDAHGNFDFKKDDAGKTSDPPELHVVTKDIVRRIRPVLRGYMDCVPWRVPQRETEHESEYEKGRSRSHGEGGKKETYKGKTVNMDKEGA